MSESKDPKSKNNGQKERKKRFGCLRILSRLFLGVIILIGIWCFMNFTGQPREGKPVTRPSAETTVIIEPLDENGDPDYIAFLNEMQSEGVTPENNAAVLLLKASGPSFRGIPVSDEYLDRMGIDRLPETGDYLVDFADWQQDKLLLDEDIALDDFHRIELRDAMFDFGMKNPWTAAQLPELAEWLQENRVSLGLFRQASTRPRFYQPLISPTGDRSLAGVLLELSQVQRMLAKSTSVSAMKHTGEGNIAKALEETIAIRRQARFANQSVLGMEYIVGCSIEQIAIEAEWKIAASGKATSAQLLEYRKRVDSLPKIDSPANCFRHGERYLMLESYLDFARDRNGVRNALRNRFSDRFFFASADWGAAMRHSNPFFDRIAQAMETASVHDGYDKLYDLESDKALYQTNPVKAYLGGRKTKGKNMAACLLRIGSARPMHFWYYREFSRIRAMHDIGQVVFSLEAYKLDHGEYPDQLAQLVPGYLEKMPVDIYGEKPFLYEKTTERYLLHSLGPDGKENREPKERERYEPDDIYPEIETENWMEIKTELLRARNGFEKEILERFLPE